MKQRQTHTLVYILAVYLLIFIVPEFSRLQNQSAKHAYPYFALGQSPTFAIKKPDPVSSSEQKPTKEDFYLRTFDWTAVDKKLRHVAFSLAKSDIKSELNQFGVLRGMENTLLLQKKGFKHIGIYKGADVYMVNYQEIFLRNLDYFARLARTLHDAVEPQQPENLLMEFLLFVQAIRYQKPPFYYNNKFINSFFPPLICLYERYGDCDSKSVLLAVFLTCHDKNEKTALAIINSLGLKHSILLVKRTPSPGMSALFITGKGYYIPLETSTPGWAPGFVSQRIWNALSSGTFRFYELP